MTYTLLDRAPRNDATSLTTYTTHTRASDTRYRVFEAWAKLAQQWLVCAPLGILTKS